MTLGSSRAISRLSSLMGNFFPSVCHLYSVYMCVYTLVLTYVRVGVYLYVCVCVCVCVFTCVPVYVYQWTSITHESAALSSGLRGECKFCVFASHPLCSRVRGEVVVSLSSASCTLIFLTLTARFMPY